MGIFTFYTILRWGWYVRVQRSSFIHFSLLERLQYDSRIWFKTSNWLRRLRPRYDHEAWRLVQLICLSSRIMLIISSLKDLCIGKAWRQQEKWDQPPNLPVASDGSEVTVVSSISCSVIGNHVLDILSPSIPPYPSLSRARAARRSRRSPFQSMMTIILGI